jgi:hypothetical protein
VEEVKVIDSSPFIINVIIDVVSPTGVFVDSGCLSYYAVNTSFARKRSLQRHEISPRQLQLATEDAPNQTIREVAEFELDINGWTQRVVGYVILDLSYPIILRKPWLEGNDIIYQAKRRLLTVRATGQVIRERG